MVYVTNPRPLLEEAVLGYHLLHGGPMTLTNEQVPAIREGESVRIVPPEVGEDCILLRSEVYDRVVALDDLPTSRATAGLVRATLEDDPFDDYRDRRR